MSNNGNRHPTLMLGIALMVLSSIGCNLSRTAARADGTVAPDLQLSADEVNPTQPIVAIDPTRTSVVQVMSLPTLVPSPILPTVSPVQSKPTITAFSEPQGCLRPSDDYTRQRVNGEILNARTIAMLRHAQDLYGGTIDFTGWAVTQGSYNPGAVSASFGTHDGGGAVDLSVRSPKNWKVLTDELDAAIHALRVAGFAAWVRETGELYANSPIHIHAIAIGDAELSPAARDQLTGQFGYFLGYNGLPKDDGIPVADRHGGPILCQWMLDLGYQDMRK